MSWLVCLLFLLSWGQLFLGGDRCLSTLKTSTHHPFPNFSVMTHAEERGRDRLSTLRRRKRIPSPPSGEARTGNRAACLFLALEDPGQ